MKKETKKTAKKTTRQNRLSKAQELNRYLDYTSLQEMVDDADRYHALKIVFESDGGQCLMDTLIKDVLQGVQLLDRYSDLNRDELVAIAARISTSRNLAKALALAAQNLEYVDVALEEALRT